jgi:DnaK suppressor protein
MDEAAVRARLAARIAELDALERATEGDATPLELDQTAIGRLSRMDAMQVQAMAAASQRMRAAERVRIAATLKGLDEGEYGWCLQCGEAIAPARLDTDPTLATCVKCAGGGR